MHWNRALTTTLAFSIMLMNTSVCMGETWQFISRDSNNMTLHVETSLIEDQYFKPEGKLTFFWLRNIWHDAQNGDTQAAFLHHAINCDTRDLYPPMAFRIQKITGQLIENRSKTFNEVRHEHKDILTVNAGPKVYAIVCPRAFKAYIEQLDNKGIQSGTNLLPENQPDADHGLDVQTLAPETASAKTVENQTQPKLQPPESPAGDSEVKSVSSEKTAVKTPVKRARYQRKTATVQKNTSQTTKPSPLAVPSMGNSAPQLPATVSDSDEKSQMPEKDSVPAVVVPTTSTSPSTEIEAPKPVELQPEAVTPSTANNEDYNTDKKETTPKKDTSTAIETTLQETQPTASFLDGEAHSDTETKRPVTYHAGRYHRQPINTLDASSEQPATPAMSSPEGATDQTFVTPPTKEVPVNPITPLDQSAASPTQSESTVKPMATPAKYEVMSPIYAPSKADLNRGKPLYQTETLKSSQKDSAPSSKQSSQPVKTDEVLPVTSQPQTKKQSSKAEVPSKKSKIDNQATAPNPTVNTAPKQPDAIDTLLQEIKDYKAPN